MHTIHKDIKNLKYVKSIKMYEILTQIHLNYKFTDCLIAKLRELKSLMA